MTIREIDQLIEEGHSLKEIAQAYSEIANLKIKKIRAQVERNRLFFQEISEVYSLVRSLAIKKRVTVPKPKKIACLIQTSNYRFYGKINSSLIDFYIEKTQSLETDRIILGRSAIDYFKASRLFKNYQSIVLKDDQPTPQELKNLVDIIKDYNKVLIFYSSLKTLLVQEPKVGDITKVQNLDEGESNFRFIFEPELPKILDFFDSQILILLLEETFLESEVARTASRFISMDQAETEANKFIKEYEKLKAFAKRSLANSRILENYASLVAVRKEIL